jgi:hypothetical protein
MLADLGFFNLPADLSDEFLAFGRRLRDLTEAVFLKYSSHKKTACLLRFLLYD